MASSSTVPVLKLSDYDTTGLWGLGRNPGESMDWSRESGATISRSDGSFGVRKVCSIQFFRASGLILYHVYRWKRVCVSRSKLLLTTLEDRKQQNVGLLIQMIRTTYPPVLNQGVALFLGGEYSTGIFVIGF